MGKEIWKEWNIRKSDLKECIGILFAVWLILVLIFLVAGARLELKEGYPLGSGIAGLFAMLLAAVISCADLVLNFPLAVSFGRVRKNFYLSAGLIYAVNHMLLLGIARALTYGELFLRDVVGWHKEYIYLDSIYVSFGWIPVYGILTAGLACAGAVVIYRFGSKGGFCILFLWLAGWMLASGDGIWKEGLETYLQLPVAGQGAVLIAVGILCYTAGFFCFRRERVR